MTLASGSAAVYGLAGACLFGIGLFVVVAHDRLLRRIVGLNVLGMGIFLTFGSIARRGSGAGFGGDPIPQALVITGIVVAFSATAMAIALLQRLFDLTSNAAPDRTDTEAQTEAEHDAA